MVVRGGIACFENNSDALGRAHDSSNCVFHAW
jgi:hypothetical protein